MEDDEQDYLGDSFSVEYPLIPLDSDISCDTFTTRGRLAVRASAHRWQAIVKNVLYSAGALLLAITIFAWVAQIPGRPFVGLSVIAFVGYIVLVKASLKDRHYGWTGINPNNGTIIDVEKRGVAMAITSVRSMEILTLLPEHLADMSLQEAKEATERSLREMNFQYQQNRQKEEGNKYLDELKAMKR